MIVSESERCTSDNESQPEKVYEQRFFTELGILIFFIFEPEKAPPPMLSTVFGIETLDNELQPENILIVDNQSLTS